MLKGRTGANTSTILFSYELIRRDKIKAEKKAKQATICLACPWNSSGFCERGKAFCETISFGGCPY